MILFYIMIFCLAIDKMQWYLLFTVGSPVSQYPPVNTSLGTSVHEIASPLRMLTIANSPVTPLGALMHSPQLAQKVSLRNDIKLIPEDLYFLP